MGAALWAVGAVVVPVYETSSATQLEWILSDSGAVGVVVETTAHNALLTQVRERLPQLRHHWTIDDVDGAPQLRDLPAAGALPLRGRRPLRLSVRECCLAPSR
ncbi:MAG TPA: AMP-binding protein [Actinomycetales bacterium]|nr:AMP-binding protein [Actinomycetales bacterium]